MSTADSQTSQSPESLTLSISPLIRITLWGFYLTLILPLPFLAAVTHAEFPIGLLWLAIGLGGLALQAALSEQVHLDPDRLEIGYPRWVPHFFRSGWSVAWTDIQALQARPTSQGGRVYYLLTKSNHAYLLPVRVAGFARMTQFIEAHTQLDMAEVKPLAQVWMYGLLLLFTVLLGVADLWMLTTGVTAVGAIG